MKGRSEYCSLVLSERYFESFIVQKDRIGGGWMAGGEMIDSVMRVIACLIA
jgi:hypothetical protein